MINQSLKSTKRFIKEIDKILSKNDADGFGTNADEIRELLDKTYGKKEEK